MGFGPCGLKKCVNFPRVRPAKMVFVRWVPKRLVDGSIKRYPYRYKSVRDKNGKVRSIYVGPAPVSSA